MPAKPFTFNTLPAPAILGIVNITPDSFSDTGRHFDPAAAIAHGRALFSAGAAVVDLGAEASSFFRAGVVPVDSQEQLRRLLPVIEGLARIPGVILSIDTRSALVAKECLARGASIINDISAATHDPAMLSAVAAAKTAVILMHIGPTFPRTPPHDDPDILATVSDYLAARVAAAVAAGIPASQIAVDPGIGFGKTMSDNWTLALTAQNLAAISSHIVLGISRKRFLETPPPERLLSPGKWQGLLTRSSRFSVSSSPHPRDAATAALTALAVKNRIPLHRLHDPALAKNPSAR